MTFQYLSVTTKKDEEHYTSEDKAAWRLWPRRDIVIQQVYANY